MNYSELKEKTEQYTATLPGLPLAPDCSLSEAILNGFLWWLYPQMKDEDLPTYEELTLKGPIPCPHPRHPLEEEPACSLCEDTGVVRNLFGGRHDCPRCG